MIGLGTLGIIVSAVGGGIGIADQLQKQKEQKRRDDEIDKIIAERKAAKENEKSQ